MTKTKMKKFFDQQLEVGMIDADEERILTAALELEAKEIKDVMLPIEKTYMLEINTVINREISQDIYTNGYSRIPIIEWLRGQASESLDHANQAGELITTLGGHPSLGIGPLLESHNHDIGNILRESLDHELASLNCYKDLLKLVEGDSIMLEEYARTMIHTEEMHLGEVDKMLRNPGDVEPFSK